VSIVSVLPWLMTLLALGLAAFSLVHARRLREQRTAVALQASAQERMTREQELLLRTLLDVSPLALMLCSELGNIVFENETARRMFFEGKSAAGQNFLRLVDDGPAPFRAALLGASDEIVGLTVDGQRETYHFARRTFAYRGEPHTLLVVRPMTREVARHDLEVLKTVVRVISHEVNNSLAPVSSLVHSARLILQSRERLERLEQVFDTVDERAKHLSSFISGYANLSRLPRPLPVPVLWEPLLSRLSALFPEAQLSAPAGAAGFCDPSQLEQALINLLRNAQEAGGSRADVRLEVTPLPEGASELKVLDRGAGFSPEALESALLPFFTTKPSGSGIGLALVREVVQAHEGRLSLGARDGGGAVITLWLPGRSSPEDPTRRARLTLTRG
jgi:two-component system, NtrC family, nitrogen regulation sensor histidine kinase NtrY